MERRRQEFTEFYTSARDDCLRIVLVSIGDRQLAEDLVAEAFTRAWMYAWSVNTTPAGLVDVTIRELTDPARLRQALADAGVPAMLTFGKVCTATSGDLPQLPQVLHKENGVLLTIDPSAMPAGSELVIGVVAEGPQRGLAAGFGLITDGSPLACHAPHTGFEPGGAAAGTR